MKCDECKQQVFELIEREAVDPAGVREILERCPECAALFSEMKAGLETAAALPLETPPASVDAVILRAAAARKSKVVPIREKRSQPFPWAVAATALLAIGIGVWAIPRDAEEGELTSPEAAMERARDGDEGASADLAAEPSLAVAEAEEMAMAGGEEPGSGAAATPPAREPRAARSKRAAKSAPARQVKEQAGREVARAPAPQANAESTAGDAVADDSASFAKGAPAEAKLAMAEDETPDASATCEQRAKKLERRKRDAKRGGDDAEDVLAIGRCYQAAGDAEKAREWLERAAEHPTTQARARDALRDLAPD